MIAAALGALGYHSESNEFTLHHLVHCASDSQALWHWIENSLTFAQTASAFRFSRNSYFSGPFSSHNEGEDKMAEELNAGFTGSPTDQPESVRKAARTATDAVKRETNALAVGAARHPHTATTLVLAIGTLAFGIGYLLGRSSAENRSYWH